MTTQSDRSAWQESLRDQLRLKMPSDSQFIAAFTQGIPSREREEGSTIGDSTIVVIHHPLTTTTRPDRLGTDPEVCAQCGHHRSWHEFPCRFPFVFQDCGCDLFTPIVCSSCFMGPLDGCRCPGFFEIEPALER